MQPAWKKNCFGKGESIDYFAFQTIYKYEAGKTLFWTQIQKEWKGEREEQKCR